MYAMKKDALILTKDIEQRIFLIRGQRVMLDMHLAGMYGVETKHLNRQVKRNRERFPEEFMFQLTREEWERLRCQIGTSKKDRRGGRRNFPYAFIEYGAVMLASVLNSPTAVKASIHVVRAFVRLREMLATHKELAIKLAQLEQRISQHDEAIRTLFEAIRQLMLPPEKPKRRIRFGVEEPKARYVAHRRKS